MKSEPNLAASGGFLHRLVRHITTWAWRDVINEALKIKEDQVRSRMEISLIDAKNWAKWEAKENNRLRTLLQKMRESIRRRKGRDMDFHRINWP